jgi:hypothetical protein
VCVCVCREVHANTLPLRMGVRLTQECMDVYSFWKLYRFCRFCRWCMCKCVCVCACVCGGGRGGCVCVCVLVCVCVYMAVAHPARANIFCHKFEKALSSLAAHLDIHRSTPTQPQIHTQTQSQTHKRTQADRQRHSHLCFPGRNEKLLHSDNPVRIVNSSCLGQPVRYLQGNTIFITLVRTILQ